MIPFRARSFHRLIRCLLVLFFVALLATPLQAAELKLEARLIWGTNDDTYSDPKHPRVDESTLIGDGKPVNKTTKHLTKGESFTIAGDDKNGCAWFVIITDLDEK